MTSKENQEVDLGFVYYKIAHAFRRILNVFKSLIHFLIKNFIILLILLALVALIGYVIDKTTKPEKKATLIINSNLESSGYLYEAISSLNHLIKDDNINELKRIGIGNNSGLTSIEISPLINVSELMEKYKDYDDEQVVLFLDKIEAKDGFLKSSQLKADYKLHEIEIQVSHRTSSSIVNKILFYLESNPYYLKQQKITLENYTDEIAANKKSLAQIDTLLSSLNTSLNKGVDRQVLAMGDNGINVRELIDKKTELIERNLELSYSIEDSKSIFTLINKPQLVNDLTILDKKRIVFPILFLFFVILFYFARKLYGKLK